MKKLIIVIPTYNEALNIKPLCAAIYKILPRIPKNWKIELLFVDDNSPDGTAKIVTKVQEKYKQKGLTIHLFNNLNKQGLGKAYMVGMEYAISTLKADALGQFDADLSHDPNKIPNLLAQLDMGFDMVIGSRYVPGGSIPANWGVYRKVLSAAGNWIVRVGLCHNEVKDWSTGFRVLSKKAYKKILVHISEEQFFGYLIMIGMVHAAVKEKLRLTEVPFKFVNRKYGESKLGIEYIIHTLLYIFSSRVNQTFYLVQNIPQLLDLRNKNT